MCVDLVLELEGMFSNKSNRWAKARRDKWTPHTTAAVDGSSSITSTGANGNAKLVGGTPLHSVARVGRL